VCFLWGRKETVNTVEINFGVTLFGPVVGLSKRIWAFEFLKMWDEVLISRTTISFWWSLLTFELPVKSPRSYSDHTVQNKVNVPLKTAVWQATVRMRSIERAARGSNWALGTPTSVWRYRPVRPRAFRFPGFWFLFFLRWVELPWMGDRPVASPLHMWENTNTVMSLNDGDTLWEMRR